MNEIIEKLMKNPMAIIAKKEIMDNVRNLWIIIMTIIFAILTISMSAVGSYFSEGWQSLEITVALMMSIVQLLVPIIALMLGYAAIVGEVEKGSMNMMISLPINRLQIVIGKLMGLGGVLSFTILVGFGIAGVVIGLMLIGASVHRTRTDYEPDRATCVACGRCYKYCPVGREHLKELGINVIQLLPVFDFNTVDETGNNPEKLRNWGYDPFAYNVPEGSYALNPDDSRRLLEFKEMVMNLHNNGFKVVMDVVYNHTANVGAPFSIFDTFMPEYFYRMDRAGHYTNGSGCGNEFRSEAPMGRKFIVECPCKLCFSTRMVLPEILHELVVVFACY